ncbi:ATP-binding protein [Streptomyces sp. 4N509B]|uniref:ATP-binding protein n=1 Tax=Streptomyces sp. 4N509B TaxID=3457413 RepID=UPI003FD5FD1B
MPAMTVNTVRQHHMVLSGIGPAAMGPVREIVRALLRLWDKTDLSFAAELGVTELLTNVWKHTSGDCELLVRETSDGVLVEVIDFDDMLPVVAKASSEDAEDGRGLALLSALVDEWEIRPLLPRGKKIRFGLKETALGHDEGEGNGRGPS